jgi:hypothetical protein
MPTGLNFELRYFSFIFTIDIANSDTSYNNTIYSFSFVTL